MPNTDKILPKRQFLAESGHTVRCSFSCILERNEISLSRRHVSVRPYKLLTIVTYDSRVVTNIVKIPVTT